MATLLQYESDFDHMRRSVNSIESGIYEMQENVGELLDVVAKSEPTLRQMGNVLDKQLETQKRTVVLLQAILDKL